MFPHDAPFDVTLVAGQTYVASITVSGSGTCHMDVWDTGGSLPDGGPGGTGDNATPQVVLTSQPHTFALPFRMGTGTAPELQLRIDGAGKMADIDAMLWHVAIFPQ